MDNYTELPHNQLILNTGETHTGIIFCPFDDTCPSDYTAEQVCTSHVSAPLLLGQSILQRLGKIEIDNTKRVLKITTR